MCLRCLAGAAGFKSGQHGRTSGGKGQQETNVFRIMQIKLALVKSLVQKSHLAHGYR